MISILVITEPLAYGILVREKLHFEFFRDAFVDNRLTLMREKDDRWNGRAEDISHGVTLFDHTSKYAHFFIYEYFFIRITNLNFRSMITSWKIILIDFNLFQGVSRGSLISVWYHPVDVWIWFYVRGAEKVQAVPSLQYLTYRTRHFQQPNVQPGFWQTAQRGHREEVH